MKKTLVFAVVLFMFAGLFAACGGEPRLMIIPMKRQ